MSEYKAALTWKRQTPDFAYKTYDRSHTVRFGGGSSVTATAAPDYLRKAELVNPEEMFIASLASCHMLTFLALAAYQGLTVDNYTDEAVGTLSKNAEGKVAVTKVVLNPRIEFGGDKQPDTATLSKLHEKAHDNCFIASSVVTEVVIKSH